MSGPSLQYTLVTLVAGSSSVVVRTFPWGTPAPTISVGSQGAWGIDAPGVHPVHFYMGFDGRSINVASGPPGAALFLGDRPLGQTCLAVPANATLRFGSASISVTYQEGSIPVHSVHGFSEVAAAAQAAPLAPGPPVPQKGPLQTVAFGTPTHLLSSDALSGIAVPHQPVPAVLQALAAPAPPPQPAAPPETAFQPAASVRKPLSAAAQEGSSTVGDAGALKNLAHYVGAGAPPQVAAGAPAPSPHVPQTADLPVLQALSPVPLPQQSDPPNWSPAAAPVGPPQAPDAKSSAGSAKPSRPSWIMIVTLLLLPFAGYFAIIWEPEGPSQAQQAATTTAQPVDSGTPSADASANEAIAPPSTSAIATASVALAAGASSKTTPEGERSPKTSPTASVAEATSSVSAGPDDPELAAKMTAAGAQALNAAFEGRLTDAASQYDALAKLSNEPVYATAARLSRGGAVRKP